jgi:DNA-binding transcriptional LysR family regulator
MQRPTTAPNWDDLRFLLALHRGKSLFDAGKMLGVATSTVARRIEGLEQALGRPLVHRGNNGTSIDADALGLVALGEQMELSMQTLARAPERGVLAGTVRISASQGFVAPLVRVLADLHAKHPALWFEIASESRIADIAKGEADIGLRIARTRSVTLIEKRAGRVPLAVFAERSYLERRLPGGSLAPEDAARHDWVGFDRALEKLPSEVWMRSYGAKRFVLRTSSLAAQEEAMLAGMGLGVLGEAQGTALRLVRVDTQGAPPPAPVFVVYRRDAARSPAVREVLHAISSALRRVLA